MRKLYVVTQGCYSDYSIIAIFSTEKLAAKYIDEYKKCYDYNSFNDIEEYMLDDLDYINAIERQYWEVTIDLVNGDINSYCVGGKEYTSKEYHLPSPIQELNRFNSGFPGHKCLAKNFIVKSYKGIEHAQKLATEYRQEFLRETSPESYTVDNNYIWFK